jgi:hypothetical protein
VYAGDPDASIGSGNYNSRYKVFKKFRLKCTDAPVSRTASVAWTETAAANGPPLSAHCTISAKGPARLAISSFALEKIEAVFTSTLYTPLAGQGNPTASSQATLGIAKDPAPPFTGNKDDSYDPYNGGWIGDDDKAPMMYFKTEGAGLPPGTPKVGFNVDAATAQFTLAHSGFKFDSMQVSQGEDVKNEKKFSTANTDGWSAEGEANSNLGAGYTGGVDANTDKVGSHHLWNVQAKGSLTANGKLEKNEEKRKEIGQNGQASWKSTGNFTSSIGGSGTVQWTIEPQVATKWVKYDSYGKAVAHKLYDFEYEGDVPTEGKDVEGWINKP